MYKIVFFKGDKTIPIKVNCRREDSLEEIEQKANNKLMNLLEDEFEIVDYEIVDIKDLND